MTDGAQQPIVVIDQAEYAISAASPKTIQLGQEGACLVFTVRPGDVAPYDRIRSRGYERAELIRLRAFPFGETTTISFRQYIAPGSKAASNRPAIIGQIHNTGGQTARPQPFVAMQVVGEKQRIITFSGGGTQEVRKSAVRWEDPVVTGRWVDWIWAFKPDRTETSLQVWRDGVQLFPNALNLGGYDGPRGPYWQFGIYRPQDLSMMRVGYANVTTRFRALDVRQRKVINNCSVENLE